MRAGGYVGVGIGSTAEQDASKMAQRAWRKHRCGQHGAKRRNHLEHEFVGAGACSCRRHRFNRLDRGRDQPMADIEARCYGKRRVASECVEEVESE